ncbi:MAG: porin [Pseudomonadota bacterium]|nr:porin [Pseudomonadota bacterium]
MVNLRLARPMLIALAACAANFLVQGSALADDAQENKALKEQMRQMMQRMDALQKQVDAMSKPAPPVVVTAPPAAPPAATGPATAKQAPPEPAFEKFAKGFYGTLDVSTDYVTKGMSELGAYHFSYADPGNDPKFGYVQGGQKGGPVGRVGWQADLSTNKSVLGYRGSHAIPGLDADFIYQIEAQPAITAAPGASTSYVQQSNVTKAGIGYGDSFVGVSGNSWGKVKFGTTYAPYKKSTDRMNPFSGMLGDYAVVMGNSGGDNRVEFGGRLDHSLWYESPKIGGLFSFDVLFSPGQNRTPFNDAQSSGSPDCSGGNAPGSGNLPNACADGAWNNAWSADLKFESGPIYVTAAYEIHQSTNRSSDGIGSNSPFYGTLYSIDPVSGQCVTTSSIIDCGAYNTFQAEFPQAAGAGSPGLVGDVGNETAFKFGVQYTFSFGLALSGIYEELHRKLPANLEWQNERQRNGFWFAATQDFTKKDNFSIGWAHAGASVGDPGGQHNYDPRSVANYANMFTAAWKHRFDKNLYWYLDAADTINHGNAHYDLGAGGRGVTTDCHDGTTQAFTDYSSAGPTTWGGCHIIGISTGLHYTF